MARKKTTTESSNIINTEKANSELTTALAQAFNKIIDINFGTLRAPAPITTPTKIIPLDYLIGGGLKSSKFIMLSATPETGKSTVAYQLSKTFLDTHENGLAVYIDIEGAGNASEKQEDDNSYQISRIDSFGLHTERFLYQPIILDIAGVFDLFDKLSEMKLTFEEKLKKDFNVLIIWDSLAATRSGKVDASVDVNQTIGFRARELTYKLDKYSPLISFRRFTIICIDQVRANLKLEGPYMPTEKTVGSFNNFKSASNITALNHQVGLWLYLSKKKVINASDGYSGVDGWEIKIHVEKCKYAPSQNSLTVIFDKTHGIDIFWTHFMFLSELTPTEDKIFKKSESKLNYPLCIKKAGAYNTLKVFDPENTKKVLYESEKFYKKDIKKLYETKDEFRQWFDYAVQTSSYMRIVEGIFKVSEVDDFEDDIEVPDIDVYNIEQSVEQQDIEQPEEQEEEEEQPEEQKPFSYNNQDDFI